MVSLNVSIFWSVNKHNYLCVFYGQLVICVISNFSNNLKSRNPTQRQAEDRYIEEPILTSSMEEMIKKSQKLQYRTREPFVNKVKELWGINEAIIDLGGSSYVHPTTVRTEPNIVSLKEEDLIRIDNFFRKRKQNAKLDSSINDFPVNLAVYLSYVYTKPVSSKSSTLKAIVDEEYGLSTSHPIRLTLQPVHSKAVEKIVDRLLSELKSQFAIEGNKIKLTDLQTFLNRKILPMVESNKSDNTYVF